MDDFVLFSDSKENLLNVFCQINDFCNKELLLNLKSYVLGKCKNGVGFLGYLISPKKVRLLQKSIKRKRLKLKRINYELQKGVCSQEKYIERVKCLFSW